MLYIVHLQVFYNLIYNQPCLRFQATLSVQDARMLVISHGNLRHANGILYNIEYHAIRAGTIT